MKCSSRYALSARFDGTETDNCGGEKVTRGWTVAVEQYWERDVWIGVDSIT